jgi:mono/diheme cytochrome c family protein
MRRKARIVLVSAAAVFMAGAAAAWVVTEPRPLYSSISADGSADSGDPIRGKVIFDAGDCASCHASPGQEDRLHLGGGMALSTPFGTFRPPNISPDTVDGIGQWQTNDLANAMLAGVSPGKAHYYPAFPYVSYAHMTHDDVRDLMAYLRTLPRVSGRAPPHEPTILFRVRRFIGFWKVLFFNRGPLVPDTSRDAQWNRGRYLTEAVAHCAECHSSRNLLGAIQPETRFAGGTDPEGSGYIPNITPARIGNWSEQDIEQMLRTGTTPNHGRVGSSMTGVVTNTAMLPPHDRSAIAAYIKSLPPRPTPQP